MSGETALDVAIVAFPETAGSALYGMVDVLSAAGSVWQTLARADTPQLLFRVRIVAPTAAPFRCCHGIPVQPDRAVADTPAPAILILPEIWLGPDEDIGGRYPELIAWIRACYQAGSCLYSACSGAVLLAETGLLDGCPATSHWGYEDLFRQRYPKVRFDPGPNLVFATSNGRIVTAGGTTSWHDLALHIIARHGSPGEAMRIAQVYLLKWHVEGQLPYRPLVRRPPHGDAVVRRCQDWLSQHFRAADALNQTVAHSGVPERTLKRRFKAATGVSLIEYLQNLRIEHAKRLLEQSALSVDDISSEAGYEDASFFRRLFKRLTGLAPSDYRRLFAPVGQAARAQLNSSVSTV